MPNIDTISGMVETAGRIRENTQALRPNIGYELESDIPTQAPPPVYPVPMDNYNYLQNRIARLEEDIEKLRQHRHDQSGIVVVPW